MLDWLYLLGVTVVWAGNLNQIWKLYQTKSTKSFSFIWLFSILASILIRLPRAVTSEYWCWSASYLVSLTIVAVLVGLAVYLRLKYPGR